MNCLEGCTGEYSQQGSAGPSSSSPPPLPQLSIASRPSTTDYLLLLLPLLFPFLILFWGWKQKWTRRKRCEAATLTRQRAGSSSRRTTEDGALLCDVLIMGTGVEAMSTAHYLVTTNFSGTIVVLEPDTKDMYNSTILPEAYLRNSVLALPLMKYLLLDIPHPTVDNPARTVRDNWKKDKRSSWWHPLAIVGTPLTRDSKQSVTLFQRIKIYLSLHAPQYVSKFCQQRKYWYAASRARQRSEWSQVRWRTSLEWLPEPHRSVIVALTAAMLGVDGERVSTYDVVSRAERDETDSSEDRLTSTLSLQEAWLDPWRRFLESRGVEFRRSTSVTALQLRQRHPNKIRRVYASTQGENGKSLEYVFRPKNVVCALHLVDTVRLLDKVAYNDVAQLRELCTLQWHERMSLHLYWKHPVCTPISLYEVVLLDTPWKLTLYPQSLPRDLYNEGDDNKNLSSVWLVSLNDPETCGRTVKRKWPLCTVDEIQREVVLQIQHSWISLHLRPSDPSHPLYDGVRIQLQQSFQQCHRHLSPWEPRRLGEEEEEEEDETKKKKKTVIEQEVSLSENKSTSDVGTTVDTSTSSSSSSSSLPLPIHEKLRMRTASPTMSPNIHTLKFRPTIVPSSPHANLYLVGDYTHGANSVNTLEMLVSNGLEAAEAIIQYDSDKRLRTTTDRHPVEWDTSLSRPSQYYFDFCRCIDDGCFRLGLPNIIDTCGGVPSFFKVYHSCAAILFALFLFCLFYF